MINTANVFARRNRLFSLLMVLIALLPTGVFGGDPIPGIDITVDQSPPGIKKHGKTDANGELILSGFRPGQCVVTIVHGGKLAVIGNQGKDRVIIPGKGKVGSIKPIRLELSRYTEASAPLRGKKGYDAYQANSQQAMASAARVESNRKRPGGTLKKDAREAALGGADADPTARANHNTTRSNRLAPKALDTDDDGDGIPTTRAQDYNSSRSNTTAAREDVELDNGMDEDCDSVVEILPMAGGRIKVTVTCAGK